MSTCLCCEGPEPAPTKTEQKKQSAAEKQVIRSQPRSEVTGSGSKAAKPEVVALKQVSLTTNLEARMSAELASLLSRLETVATRLEVVVAASGTKGGAAPAAVASSEPEVSAAFVTAYDQIVNGALATFLDLSQQIGGDVKSQSDLVKSAFIAQRAFLVLAAKAKEPAQNELVPLLQPTSSQLQAVQEFRESKRTSALFNHLSAISESISALAWVTVSPTPGPFVKEMSDAGQFYGNRVLKEFREKDKKHVDWSRSWFTVLTELIAYIKQYHTTGVVWNSQGVSASSVSTGPPVPSGGPPPPPPPPPPGPPPPSDPAPEVDDGRAALFAALNKGDKATQGLRKVKESMKTHKNPNLKLHTAQPYRATPKPFSPSAGDTGSTAPPLKHPPKCALDGKKWLVEYQEGNKNIVISETNSKQTVYIFRCRDSVVQIKGKIASLTMDNCKKTAVVFDDVISSMDFVNCQSVQAQVMGKVPTLAIDKTDGCMVYLSAASKQTEVVTAKSSEMNILIPDANGEYQEFSIPEQFKTTWNGKKLVTACSDTNQ